MSALLHRPNYLLRWDFNNPQSIGCDVVTTSHRLLELPIGNDSHLESLLRSVPRDQFSIVTSGFNAIHLNQQQHGTLGTVSVAEAIEIVRQSRLSMIVKQIDRHDAQLANITKRLASELAECHVGLRVIRPSLDLCISSPCFAGYFSCDSQPSVCWQLRGKTRTWIYPQEEMFINQQEFEQIVHGGCQRMPYYEPAFDDFATAKEVLPGEMLAWPHPSPYRVTCDDSLNVALKLNFQSRESQRLSNIHLVNSKLRLLAIDRLCDARTDGLLAGLKNSFAELLRLSQSTRRSEIEPSFELAPDADFGIRCFSEPDEQSRSNQISAMVAAGIRTPNSIPTSIVALEN